MHNNNLFIIIAANYSRYKRLHAKQIPFINSSTSKLFSVQMQSK